MAIKNFTGDSENVTESQLDLFDATFFAPGRKLDADQYSADDLDGVTESVFGSGNLSHAVLQASQIDGAALSNELFGPGSSNITLENGLTSASTALPITDDFFNGNAFRGAPVSIDTDRPLNENGFSGTGGQNGNFTASTIGSVSASTLSSDTGVFKGSGSGLTPGNGLNGASGTDGNSGNDGTDGNDGLTPELPEIPDIGDINQIINDIFIDLGDLITTLTASINDITTNLGDVINNLDIIGVPDLTEITNTVTDLTQNLTENVFNTVNTITDLTENIANLLGGDGDGLIINLDTNLLDTVILDTGIPLNDLANSNTDLDVNLDPAVTLVKSTAALTGIEILQQALNNLDGGISTLQQTIDATTNVVSDLDLSGLGENVDDLADALAGLDDTVATVVDDLNDTLNDTVDALNLGGGDDGEADGLIGQTADPVLNDIGNVLDDLTGDATGDTTDALDDAVDTVTDIADDLTGSLLDGIAGENNDNDGGADTDVTADLGLVGGGEELVDEPAEAALDPVEDLTGDIDINAGLDTDLFGDSEIDNNAGDTDITLDTNIDLVDNPVNETTGDIPLDPVETLTGDIDLGVDTSVDVLDDFADPLVNDAEGGSGEDTVLADTGDTFGDTAEDVFEGDIEIDLVDAVGDTADSLDVTTDPVTDLLGGESGDDSGDAGLVPDTDIDLSGINLLGSDAETGQDGTESITDEIDLGLDSALDLLDSGGSENSDSTGSDNGDGLWTETALDDTGGLFDDVVDGLDGLTDPLPDPLGSVSEGLGILDTNPDSGGGSGGGLFGGLFG